MCYSTSSSFGTFLFTFSICFYLWLKGNKVQKTISNMIFVVSLMQVLEGLLWLNIKCTKTNKEISSLIPILLFLQPVVALGSIYYFKTGFLNNQIYMNILYCWILFSPVFLYWWANNSSGKCTKVGPKGHLEWPMPNRSLLCTFMQLAYFVAIGICFVTLKTEWYGYFYSIIAGISFYISITVYGNSWSSMWCHFVNSLSIGALFI